MYIYTLKNYQLLQQFLRLLYQNCFQLDFFVVITFFSQNSLGSDGENFVFEIPEAEIIKRADLRYCIRDLSLVHDRTVFLLSKFISSATSRIMF